ncbi:MAG: 30S ribosomal protein S20 [Candidatus Saccharimonadales bacterium]
MPIIKSAIKRAKQTVKRRERNILIKKDIKSVVKAFSAKPNAKNLSAVQSELDTAVKKGLIKKNTAARRKANLAKVAKNSGVKLASVAKKPTVKKPAKSTSEQKTTKKVVAKKATPKKPADKTAVKKSPVKKPTK